MSLACAYSATLALEIRNGGASLSMVRLATSIDPTSAEMQKKSKELVMRTDVMAKGQGSIDYTMVVKGTGLVTEMGNKYNLTNTTSRKGSGPIDGPTQLTFETDAESKKYLLTLSHTFEDKSDSPVVEQVVTVHESKGNPPSEERTIRYSGLDDVPTGFKIDDPVSTMGEIPLIECTFDPSLGKISGEKTIKGHYGANGSDVKGTFVFRWTLTPRN